MEWFTYGVAVLIWLSMIIYAVLGGADFGGGIWTLLFIGKQRKQALDLIRGAVGPVWEANNVWLIYLVIALYATFPIVAALLATALFFPLTLALIGIVLRGASFAFRGAVTRIVTVKATWSSVFGIASLITPFLFGACAAAVTSGELRVHGGQAPEMVWHPWLSPFALLIGVSALALCATIAAVFLTVEAQRINDQGLMNAFRARALGAGAVLAALGLAALLLARYEAPVFWHGFLDHGWWAAGITALLGLATALALWFRQYRWARILVVVDAAAFFGTWGITLLPYIVPPDLTLTQAASPPLTMREFFLSALVGMLVLLPSLWFLLHVFKFQQVVPPVHEKEVKEG